jgi:hypothetical protein
MYGGISFDWSAPPDAQLKLSTYLNPTKIPYTTLHGHSLKGIRQMRQNPVVGNRTFAINPNPQSKPNIMIKEKEFKTEDNQPQAQPNLLAKGLHPK